MKKLLWWQLATTVITLAFFFAVRYLFDDSVASVTTICICFAMVYGANRSDPISIPRTCGRNCLMATSGAVIENAFSGFFLSLFIGALLTLIILYGLSFTDVTAKHLNIGRRKAILASLAQISVIFFTILVTLHQAG